MADQLQLRGGTTAQTATFTGALREVTVDTDKDTLVVHDNALAGGYPLLRENGSNSALALASAATPSLKFTGDTNTGVFSPGADTIAVSTGGSEHARIDPSGRLLVGTSSAREDVSGNDPLAQFERAGGSGILASCTRNSNDAFGPRIALVKSRGSAVGSNTVVQSGDAIGSIGFYGADGTNLEIAAMIQAEVDGTPGVGDMPGRLVFSTTADGASSPTERMWIRKDGYTIHHAPTWVLEVATAAASGTTDRLIYGVSERAAAGAGGGNQVFIVYSNGNVVNSNNSYGSASDIKLKENIVDANSQWDDLKALQVRNYNFKEGQTHTQIGLVAQEAELVSPGLVSESPDRDEDGNDLGTVTKSVNYSVLYMKAVKALQEAMERIEQLEAKVAALESA
jgi:hypothetical protein